MGVAQFQGQQDIKSTRKYFTGITALRAGQILHYDETATKTNADVRLRLGHAVKVPTTNSVGHFAGIVSDGDAGKTGPCFVELLQPQSGDVVDVEVNGATAVVAQDLLEPDVTKGALIKATAAAGDHLFRCFEATSADTKVALRCERV